MNCCHSSSRGLRSFWAVALLFGACAETSHDMDDGGAPSVDASLDGGPPEDAGGATEEDGGEPIDAGGEETDAGDPDGGSGGGSGYFEDGFESGDFSKTETVGTESWAWAPTNVTVDSAAAFDGSNSALFTYGPNAAGEDDWAELSFKFGKELSEAWVEYQLFVPSNFAHRSESPSNNKFFQFNYNGSTYQALTVEYGWQAANESYMRRFLSASEDPSDGSSNWPTSDTSTPDFIGSGAPFALRIGQWNQVRIHFRSSTDGTTADGYAAVYVNGALVHDLHWAFWNITTGGRINGGYIMGWSNSGYTDATEFRVDGFKAYDTDPGWE